MEKIIKLILPVGELTFEQTYVVIDKNNLLKSMEIISNMGLNDLPKNLFIEIINLSPSDFNTFIITVKQSYNYKLWNKLYLLCIVHNILTNRNNNEYFNQVESLAFNKCDCDFIQDLKSIPYNLPVTVLVVYICIHGRDYIDDLKKDNTNTLFGKIFPKSNVILHGDIICYDIDKYIIEHMYLLNSFDSKFERICIEDDKISSLFSSQLLNNEYLTILDSAPDDRFESEEFTEHFIFALTKSIILSNMHGLELKTGLIRFKNIVDKLNLIVTDVLVKVLLNYMNNVTTSVFRLFDPKNMLNWDTPVLLKFIIYFVKEEDWYNFKSEIKMENTYVINKLLPQIKKESEGDFISCNKEFRKTLKYFIENIVYFKTNIRPKRSKNNSYLGVALGGLEKMNNMKEVYDFIELNSDLLI
jgi:hypothetical protein